MRALGARGGAAGVTEMTLRLAEARRGDGIYQRGIAAAE